MSASPPSGLSAWLEQAWLDRYLERRLDADEAAWFEGYALDKAHLLRAIELDTDLRDGMAAAVPVAAASDGAERATAQRRPLPRWVALAATLAIGLGLGWIGTGLREGGIGTGIASPPHIVFDTLRGESQAVRASGGSGDVVLVDIAVPAAATEVTLRLASQTPLALRVGPDGFATAILPAEFARPGTSAELRYRDGGTDVIRTLQWPAR